MTIKKKTSTVELIDLMFDWAEGSISVPRIDRLSFAALSNADSPAGIIRILEDYLDDDELEFVRSLNADEFGEFVQSWVDRTKDLQELDAEDELDLDDGLRALLDDEPTEIAEPRDGDDNLGAPLTAEEKSRIDAFYSTEKGAYVAISAALLGVDPFDPAFVRGVLEG
ncbi:hypothetical protein [Brevibacterium album]|uniref:hypothetical protein n=1 Tax=Brevibacterium album TaxID=417948 RepID=UPI0004235724|nr:hypothetical protein [Brevibacterium album]